MLTGHFNVCHRIVPAASSSYDQNGVQTWCKAMCSETDLNVPITFLPNVNMEVLGRVAQERSIAKLDTFSGLCCVMRRNVLAWMIQGALEHKHTHIYPMIPIQGSHNFDPILSTMACLAASASFFINNFLLLGRWTRNSRQILT